VNENYCDLLLHVAERIVPPLYGLVGVMSERHQASESELTTMAAT